MKLAAAARRFDGQVFADAYNPSTTLQGQFGLFDDSTRDGMTIERRIISMRPENTIPTRRTLTHDGITWLIGDSQRDYFKGRAIRHKYVAHQATELATIRTLAQALAGTGGTPAWAARVWVKGSKEVEISSDVVDAFNIYFAPNETITEAMLVQIAGRWHILRAVYPSSAGLLVALADELPDPVVTTAAFTLKTYNPLTDTSTATTPTVAALRIRWQSHFSYPVQGAEGYKPGDTVLVVLKSAVTPKVGDAVTVAGTDYRIDAKLDEGTCWSLHLRHD
jgi:hypothetical protein